jgi:hypothetical protein
MLSTVIDSGPYEQKPVPGITRKLVSLWLYWTSDEPKRDKPPTSTPRKRQKASKAEPHIKAEPLIKLEVKDEPPSAPTIVRRYKSSALISAPTSAAKRSGATVTRRALAASDTNTGESASEDKSKRKGTGDPRGSEDLQDIREILNKVENPTD